MEHLLNEEKQHRKKADKAKFQLEDCMADLEDKLRDLQNTVQQQVRIL